jgi:uncharacterized membrane protein YuzA (DUF378 family)
MTSVTLGLTFVLIGLFTMIGTLLKWRLVTHSGKLINLILGDSAARVIYIIIGFAFFILGLGQIFGLNWLGK